MKEGKYRAITKLLRLRILRGVYEERIPAEVKLAKELGVSPVTLAQALVQLEAMGLVQRKWRSGTFIVPREERSRALAPVSVLLSEAAYGPRPVQSEFTNGFQQVAQAKGLHIILVTHLKTETDAAVDEAVNYLKGLACIGACMYGYAMNAARALRLTATPGSAVVADCETPDLILPTVNHDNREAGRLPAAHLLRLGHRRIVLVDPLMPSPERTVRANAMAELVRQAGGTFRYLQGPDFTWGVPPCVALLQAPERPTAVVCGDQSTAIDMAKAASSLGMSVPGDISILCKGSINPEQKSGSFTNVEFDEYALGAGAFDLFLGSEPGKEPRQVIIPVRLHDRGTTAPPREQE